MLLLLWGCVKALRGNFYLAFEHTVTNATLLFILEQRTGLELTKNTSICFSMEQGLKVNNASDMMLECWFRLLVVRFFMFCLKTNFPRQLDH